MQAYMKSALPYAGVPMPTLRKVVRTLYPARTWQPGFAAWHDTVLALWENAAYREERYVAISLAARRRELDALPVLERLIVEGAWWDYVDWLVKPVAELLRRHPDELKPVLRAWARDDSMWKRRAAIISQLGFKGDTDLDLLYDAIEPNLDHESFWVRKAIGWALRDLSWHDKDEVARYVRANEHRLSALSRREGMKNIEKGFV
jgi:3-methyladenine DNA glycosylase AlkD